MAAGAGLTRAWHKLQQALGTEYSLLKAGNSSRKWPQTRQGAFLVGAWWLFAGAVSTAVGGVAAVLVFLRLVDLALALAPRAADGPEGSDSAGWLRIAVWIVPACSGTVGGVVIGLAQWLLLGRWLVHPARWIPTAAVLGALMMMVVVVTPRFVPALVMVLFLSWVWWGITGVLWLRWLGQEQTPSSSRLSQTKPLETDR